MDHKCFLAIGAMTFKPTKQLMTVIGIELGEQMIMMIILEIIFTIVILISDLATMDARGYIRIVGRTKEIIIRGGINIYPKEIEEVLISHPYIADAAVS